MADLERDFLARLGAEVAQNGYAVCAIKPGTKRPDYDGWEGSQPGNTAEVQGWCKAGKQSHGVGLLTRTTPAVDIDVLDVAVAEAMEDFVAKKAPGGLLRIGLFPKRGMLFRCERTFNKVQSRVYLDRVGRRSKLEILGDGQQIVAFHIHPDTGKPYRWRGKSPLTVKAEDLPLLTPELAKEFVAEFERLADEHGFTLERKGGLKPLGSQQPAGKALDGDDWTSEVDTKGPTGLTPEEMREKLLLIPAFEDYTGWLTIGQALAHEYRDDPDVGEELFIFYSERCLNFDEAECRAKWASFKRNREPGAKTARYILQLVKETKQEAATAKKQEVEEAFAAAETLDEVMQAAQIAKKAAFEPVLRSMVAKLFSDAMKRVTGQRPSPREARDAVRYEDSNRKMPEWMGEWVYLLEEERFFRREDGTALTKAAFNDGFTRKMLTRRDVLEGRAFAEVQPADAALNVYQISVARGRRYMPGEDELFTLNGSVYVNTYSREGIPEEPDTLSDVEKADVATVKRHFEYLFADERERGIILSLIAYIVQTGKRVNWSALIQGTDGSGKTFIAMLLGLVLGASNVRMLAGETLHDRFTGWAESYQVVCVEEIRMVGHNRHDVLNKLKPFITNDIIEIRRMNVDSYHTMNTASYFLFTNHKDALPINGNDRRYFVSFTRWQTREALKAFTDENPGYFENLYAAAERSAGAIRKWFRKMKLHPDFNPKGSAPMTKGRAYMVDLGKGEEMEWIEEVLADSTEIDVSEGLMNVTKLSDKVADLPGGVVPQTRTLAKALSDRGFTYLGRMRVGGERARFWSTTPELFQDERGDFSPALVQQYIDFRGL